MITGDLNPILKAYSLICTCVPPEDLLDLFKIKRDLRDVIVRIVEERPEIIDKISGMGEVVIILLNEVYGEFKVKKQRKRS